MSNIKEAKIMSKKGFYVGDICYALGEDVYHGFWGDVCGFEPGHYTLPADHPKYPGLSFAVSNTAYGDGTYHDNYGRTYCVDAGVIGLVPLELVSEDPAGGHMFPGAGTATFKVERYGYIMTINLPNDPNSIVIETGYTEDYEEYD